MAPDDLASQEPVGRDERATTGTEATQLADSGTGVGTPAPRPAEAVTPAARRVVGDTAPLSGSAPDTVPTGPPKGFRLRLERGALIDRYVVLDRLGSGGMGVVYLAYDSDLERRVAIKLLQIGGGHDPELARARLMREGQAIAQLSHPNVVQVYELGALDDELFIVMEYVAGMSATRWLKQEKRSREEILDIFLQAGRGLAAAHEKGIIHRDFKPENILVGDDGRVRVLDFGLARALEGPVEPPADGPSISTSSGSLHSSLTQAGAVMGTPAYMPPEQHAGEETGPASDQFSFCVALWEAVCGERPFEGETYHELAWHVHLGKTRELPPDARIPGWLASLMRRGLSVDPAKRFPTMDALLAELGRDRGARRRRLLLAVAFAALASVAVFAVATRAGAAEPCTGAERRLVGVWDAAAREELRDAFTAVPARYATEVLSIVDGELDAYAEDWLAMHREACEATQVHGEQSEEVLDARMACLNRRREELSSLVQLLAKADADLIQRAPRAVRGLTPIDSCADIDALMAPVPMPDDPAVRAKVADVQRDIARVKALQLAGKVDEGLEAATRALEQAKATGYGPLRAEALSHMAYVYASKNDDAEAEKWFLDAYFEAIASHHTDVASECAVELIYAVTKQGRHDEALAWVRRARAWLAALGENDDRKADLEINLGLLYEETGKYEQALEHHAAALDIRRRLYGDKHYKVGAALNNEGLVYHSLGKYEEALKRFKEANEIFRQTLGAHHPHVGWTAQNIGNIAFALGKLDEAEPAFRTAVEIISEAYGPKSANAASTRFSMATLLSERGKLDEARAELEAVLSIFEAERGKDSMDVAMVANSLGIIATQQGRHEDALAYYQRSGAIRIATYGAEHEQAGRAHEALGNAYSSMGRYRESLKEYEQAEAIYRKVFGAEHDQVAGALIGMGEARLNLGQPAAAIPSLEEAVTVLAKVEANRSFQAIAEFVLAEALWNAGRDRDRARELAREARDIFASAQDQDSRNKADEVKRWLESR